MSHTPGPWRACHDGKCSCKTVNCADYPIAKITVGAWGDDYAALRIVGESSLDQKVEAYMEQITYGEVDEKTATANARLIASAPDLLEALQKIAAIEDQQFGGDWDEIIEAREIANAAIAKATGVA